MNIRDVNILTEQLKYRLKIVNMRYKPLDNRHPAILEIENLIYQLSDVLPYLLDDSDSFDKYKFAKDIINKY